MAYAQLRACWAAEGTAALTLLDRKGRVLARILGSTTRAAPGGPRHRDRVRAKARLVSPDRYPTAAAQADRRIPVPHERVAEWYRCYEQEKRKRGLVDFDDLLGQCADAIEAGPVVRCRTALAVPPPVRRRVPGPQPAPGAPAARVAGRPPDLRVVGDPNQAIYG
ncbi:MAG: hypothetical protein U0P45_09465 [Acidimicrobiales bacterium]